MKKSKRPEAASTERTNSSERIVMSENPDVGLLITYLERINQTMMKYCSHELSTDKKQELRRLLEQMDTNKAGLPASLKIDLEETVRNVRAMLEIDDSESKKFSQL